MISTNVGLPTVGLAPTYAVGGVSTVLPTTTGVVAPALLGSRVGAVGYGAGYGLGGVAYGGPSVLATSAVAPVTTVGLGAVGLGAGYGAGYGLGASRIGLTGTTVVGTGLATGYGVGVAGLTAPAVVGGGLSAANAALYQSQTTVAPPIYNKAAVLGRAPESKIEYIPYEVKELVYDTVEKLEVTPIQKTLTEYEQIRHIETIPIQKAVTDYYALEHVTEFVPQNFTDRVVDYVQQETISEAVNYRPVDSQRVIPNPTLGLGVSAVGVTAPVVGGVTTAVVGAPAVGVVGAPVVGARYGAGYGVVGAPVVGAGLGYATTGVAVTPAIATSVVGGYGGYGYSTGVVPTALGVSSYNPALVTSYAPSGLIA